MKKYNVAILGASGAVGQAMIKGLEERNFPIQQLKLLASKKSAGKAITFHNQTLTIEEANETSFEGMDIVLGAVSNSLSKKFAPFIQKAKALYIDNSSAFRLDENVPLVIPEINPKDIKLHQGIIANPNCSTIIVLTAINAIHQHSPIEKMIVSTYQAVSGAGNEGMLELIEQVTNMIENKPIEPHIFAKQIAYNLIPQIGSFDESGYSDEEMKMQNEGRKILHSKNLKVNCTCVRVPVLRSHSISITLITSDKCEIDEVKEWIKNAKGCKLVDQPEMNIYPTPLDSSNQDLIHVGRIRQDLCNDNGIALWCCGDQIRKGAAINAIQIAETYIQTLKQS